MFPLYVYVLPPSQICFKALAPSPGGGGGGGAVQDLFASGQEDTLGGQLAVGLMLYQVGGARVFSFP